MMNVESGSIVIPPFGANIEQTIVCNFYTNTSFVACKTFEADLIGKLKRVSLIVHGGTVGTDSANITLKDHMNFDYFLQKFAVTNVETEYDEAIYINNIAGKMDIYLLDRPQLYIESTVKTYGTIIFHMEPLV